jgi:3-phenylpropionate/trans-cinnamate dioxygenase ferredoxin reductase subunit
MSADAVVVVGAGHAAGEMSVALRSHGFTGEIILVGEEAYLPYQRPALSKGFLTGEISHEQLYVRSAASFAKADIRLIPNVRVLSIDRARKCISASDGRIIFYSKLVLATGGRPRRLALTDVRVDAAPNIHYLRTIDDVTSMQNSFKKGMRLVIVGGGYIGLEVAAAARQRELNVTLLESLPRVLARVTAPQVSEFYAALHRSAGVDVRVNAELTGFVFDPTGRVVGVETRDGGGVAADFVLVGIGLLPNTELAESAGLKIDNGIAVDEFGQTSDPDILAIGDCTSHPNRHAGRRVRLESVASSVEQARTAAAWLSGKSLPNDSVPWFWSDQYKLKLQIVGLNQGYDQVVLRGSPDSQSFLAFYLKDGTLLAVDAVNRIRDFMTCKKLVAARIRVDPSQLADESIPLTTLVAGKPQPV